MIGLYERICKVYYDSTKALVLSIFHHSTFDHIELAQEIYFIIF